MASMLAESRSAAVMGGTARQAYFASPFRLSPNPGVSITVKSSATPSSSSSGIHQCRLDHPLSHGQQRGGRVRTIGLWIDREGASHTQILRLDLLRQVCVEQRVQEGGLAQPRLA